MGMTMCNIATGAHKSNAVHPQNTFDAPRQILTRQEELCRQPRWQIVEMAQMDARDQLRVPRPDGVPVKKRDKIRAVPDGNMRQSSLGDLTERAGRIGQFTALQNQKTAPWGAVLEIRFGKDPT